MKKTISLIIIAALLASVLCACKTERNENSHTLYFKDISKSGDVVATFFNSDTEKTVDIKMKKISEDGDSYTFSCDGDTSEYNMAYITYDGIETDKFAFNKCVSGWYNSQQGVMPYVEGGNTTYKYKSKDAKFKFNGYDKTVHIWTPEDYDASSEEKYATIYLLDGQGIDFLEAPEGHYISETGNYTEQIRAMMSVTGYKTIIAAIETIGATEADYSRDDELVPDLGKPVTGNSTEWTKKCCNKLAEFISGTVAPYIRKNYNVYSDARHTSIQGTSLSGLAAFYIAMECPEVFGTAGAMSPSFWVYDEAAWKSYLSQKTFDKNSPFLYFYTGGKKEDTGKETKMVYKILTGLNYPKEKLAFHYNENGGHAVPYWKCMFAEFLEAMVFQNVQALNTDNNAG